METNTTEIIRLQNEIEFLRGDLENHLCPLKERFITVYEIFHQEYSRVMKKHNIFKTCYDAPYALGPENEFTSFTVKNYPDGPRIVATWIFEFRDGEEYYNDEIMPLGILLKSDEEVRAIAAKEAHEWAIKELMAEGKIKDPEI